MSLHYNYEKVSWLATWQDPGEGIIHAQHIPLSDRHPSIHEAPPSPSSSLSPSSPTQAEKNSSKRTFLLLIKAFVGTGVLFLPRAFYNGGLIFSIVVLTIMAYLTYLGMNLLVQCTYKIPGSFQDVACVLFGDKGKALVEASIFASQLGFCMAYTIFVAHNLQDLIAVFSECKLVVASELLVFSQLIVYIPLAQVQNLSYFAPFALAANVFIFLGLAKIFAFDSHQIATKGVAPDVVWFNPDAFAIFLGTVAFTFEGIGMVTPLCNAMMDRKKFPSVLGFTLIVTTVLYIIIASMSYLAFGGKTQTIILLNMPTKQALVALAQVLYIFAILFTYPVQLFPAMRILEEWVLGPRSSRKTWTRLAKFKRTLLSVATVFTMTLFSWLGNTSLEHFISLVGALACVPLSFIYPAVFHYKAVAQTAWQRKLDVGLAVFGVTCMIFVIIVTLYSWEGSAESDVLTECRLQIQDKEPDAAPDTSGAASPDAHGR